MEDNPKNKAYNVVFNLERPFEDEIIYFLMVDRFHDGKKRESVINGHRKFGFGNENELGKPYGGTIKGIIKKLGYIQQLGCTAIWITPVFENNPESYHGYAIQHFLKVDKRFGTKQELKKLVQKAHQLGLKVFLDVVINHSGDNWFYKKQRTYQYVMGNSYPFGGWRSKSRPLPAVFRDSAGYEQKGMITNWDAYPETQEGDFFSLKKFKLDETAKGKEIQDHLAKIYCHWIFECDFDGFRLDTAKHMTPLTVARFCSTIKSYASALGKSNFPIFIEAPLSDEACNAYFENFKKENSSVHSTPDTALDFQLHYFLPRVFEGVESPNKLIHRWSSISKQGDLRGKQATRLVTFLDNHDQIESNFKQRIANRLNDEQLLACFAFLLFYPGIPCIYYGTEQGLSGHGFGDKYVREAMFCQQNELDLFDTSAFLYQGFQNLLKIRRYFSNSGLKEFGASLISINDDIFRRNRKYNQILCHFRKQNNGFLYIYCYNLSNETIKFAIKLNKICFKIERLAGEWKNLELINSKVIGITLASKTFTIFKIT